MYKLPEESKPIPTRVMTDCARDLTETAPKDITSELQPDAVLLQDVVFSEKGTALLDRLNRVLDAPCESAQGSRGISRLTDHIYL
eukprot:7803160-Pyramimonas_sp.AAC.1